jgi:hypothetical protein
VLILVDAFGLPAVGMGRGRRGGCAETSLRGTRVHVVEEITRDLLSVREDCCHHSKSEVNAQPKDAYASTLVNTFVGSQGENAFRSNSTNALDSGESTTSR